MARRELHARADREHRGGGVVSAQEIVVTLHIDASLAVRAGHGRAGPQKLRIGEDELAQLTERQRDTLARHVAGETGWSRPLNRGAPRIATADMETLARLLDVRASKMLDAAARTVAGEHVMQWPGGVVVREAWTRDRWRHLGSPLYWDDFHEKVTNYVQRMAIGEPIAAESNDER